MRLLHTCTAFYTDFVRKATYAYNIRLCASSILLHMIEFGFARKTTYALEAAYAYKVRLLRVSDLSLRV